MSSTTQSSVTQPGAAERYGNDYNAGDAMASEAGQLITRKLHHRLRPDRATAHCIVSMLNADAAVSKPLVQPLVARRTHYNRPSLVNV